MLLPFQEQIKAHALRETPKEACGLLIKSPEMPLQALPSINVALDPARYFRIAPRAFIEAAQMGKVEGYYHSHVQEGAEFSPCDKTVAENVRIPCWLYSIAADEFNLYTPTGETHLEGRSFVLGVHDCAALVIDYYRQQLGIVLPDFDRTPDHVSKGYPDLSKYLRENRFSIVSNPRPHDVLIMSAGPHGYANHAGIFLDGGLMLHQLFSKPSCKTVYGGHWAHKTVMILRHHSEI